MVNAALERGVVVNAGNGEGKGWFRQHGARWLFKLGVDKGCEVVVDDASKGLCEGYGAPRRHQREASGGVLRHTGCAKSPKDGRAPGE